MELRKSHCFTQIITAPTTGGEGTLVGVYVFVDGSSMWKRERVFENTTSGETIAAYIKHQCGEAADWIAKAW